MEFKRKLAQTDLDSYMSEAAANASISIEAFATRVKYSSTRSLHYTDPPKYRSPRRLKFPAGRL